MACAPHPPLFHFHHSAPQEFSMSQHTARLPYHQLSSKAFMGLVNLSETIKKGALGARLTELVFLRVSQINGCAYCMDMHWNYLIKEGVEPRHLNALAG
jgi:AhpD family alkylhydroperoxidase